MVRDLSVKPDGSLVMLARTVVAGATEGAARAGCA
jgi:hypothetical protein